MKNWRKVQLVLEGIVVIGIVLAVVFSDETLFVETPTTSAGAIVVLGGDPADRVWRGAELFQQFRMPDSEFRNEESRVPGTGYRDADRVTRRAGREGPVVVVSGVGDCFLMKDRLVLAGVPENQVVTECESRSTRENAEFSVKILRELGVKSAVIVTTWWHSRRALASFQQAGPELTFYSMPAYGKSMEGKPGLPDWVPILWEYLKTTHYAVFFGIY